MKRNERLSGRKIIQILALNALVIAAVYLFFGWFLNQSAEHLFAGAEGRFTYREVGLCLLLSLLINGSIDYRLLVKPVWNMESAVGRYREAVRDDEVDHSIETVLYYLLKQQEVAYEKNKIEEKQRKKAELYALQSQIDPHFLYNALDSIRGYALLNDMNEISEITEALSRVFRNMISDKQEQIPLRQERDNINNYMRIQQFRFNNRFHYFFEADEELLDKYMVPRMVLQPLVENAIMHGLEPKVDGGWIKVTAEATGRRFIVTISDNGVGVSKERLEFLRRAMKLYPADYNINEDTGHAGIALININRRIKLNYGKQFGIIVSSTPNIRTTIEVTLPLLLNKK